LFDLQMNQIACSLSTRVSRRIHFYLQFIYFT